MEILGGKIDFILHSMGMSVNVEKEGIIQIKTMILQLKV